MEQYNVTGMELRGVQCPCGKGCIKSTGRDGLFSQSFDELDGRGRDSFGAGHYPGSRGIRLRCIEKGRRKGDFRQRRLGL